MKNKIILIILSSILLLLTLFIFFLLNPDENRKLLVDDYDKCMALTYTISLDESKKMLDSGFSIASNTEVDEVTVSSAPISTHSGSISYYFNSTNLEYLGKNCANSNSDKYISGQNKKINVKEGKN